jgi:hypothetical protein
MFERSYTCLSDPFLRRWEAVAVLSVALAGNAGVAVADPAQLGPSTTECPHETTIFQQDNRVREHGLWRVTRHVRAYRLTGSDAAFYESGLAIDADGAPNAYHPSGSPPGLDSLAAAGYPTSCSVLVCMGRSPQGGNIYARTNGGQFDGYYVSMSTLMDERTDAQGHAMHGAGDYKRYVDSTTVPYIAVASRAMKPFRLQRGVHNTSPPGELAYVVNLRNGLASPAIFADVGTNNTLGEGSIALAKALGFPERQQSPTHGGLPSGILTIIFPESKSTPPWPRDASDITIAANERFKAWGGLARVKACFPKAVAGMVLEDMDEDGKPNQFAFRDGVTVSVQGVTLGKAGGPTSSENRAALENPPISAKRFARIAGTTRGQYVAYARNASPVEGLAWLRVVRDVYQRAWAVGGQRSHQRLGRVERPVAVKALGTYRQFSSPHARRLANSPSRLIGETS